MIDFGQLAEHYDSFYTTEEGKKIDSLEKALVERMMKEIPPGKTLEIGCGTGHWTEYFAQKGNEIIGIDISREMVEIAERKNIPNTICLVHDMLNMPFRDKFFENIFAITSIDFVKEKFKAFMEIKRVLKDYGYLLVAVLNKLSPHIKQLPKDKIIKKAEDILFTPEELKEYLSLLGEPKIDGALYWKAGEFIDDILPEDMRDINQATFIVGVVRYDKFK